MSESDFTPKSQPLILRVEISAEQASTLAPLLGSALPAVPAAVPAADEVVDDRLRDLEVREAEFEADVQLREDKMERWRTELEELEQTLERRERDLVSYVDQLQGAMANPSNDAWWQRPAGGDGGVY